MTFTVQEVFGWAPGSVVAAERRVGAVRGVDTVVQAADTLLPQEAHEKLQANQSKHAQTEDGQDHHVRQLLHRLDQSTHDGLQTFMEEKNLMKLWTVLITFKCTCKSEKSQHLVYLE